ncbi:MAG: AAA family ATPase [Candidatus Omnitrophica bacterium]|nr:AAA family ATPase [Candidatus Omnitrophota bacterium]MBD3268834.1 AAA family ATPase [Candidatus Omnitrophota bacterium]
MRKKKNIFLTGAPSCGKTTVMKKVIEGLKYPAKGFYTQEEREGGRRVWFLMRTLEGKQGYLGHQDIKSDFHIRRYGVSCENIDNVAVPAIEPQEGYVVILDEIGKMECFSEKFQKTVLEVLDAPNIVIGTITLGGTDFILEVKKRGDLEIIEVREDNRDRLPSIILDKIANFFILFKEAR